MVIDQSQKTNVGDDAILEFLGSIVLIDLDKKNFQCKLCNETISSLSYLKYHMKSHHEDGDWICNQCDFQTNNFSLFKTHVKEFHLKRYSCEFCGHEAGAKSDIKTHIEVQHKDLAYKCELCSTETSTHEFLQSHIIKDHKSILISCDTCSYVATSKINIEMHKGSKHKGVVYKCDMCVFVADTFEESQKHKTKEHQASDNNCNKCSFTSKDKTELEVHIQNHSISKALKCHQCNSKFSSEEDLKVHTMEHTINHAIKCNKCDETFVSIESLNNHKQKMHKSYRPCRNFLNNTCSYGVSCLFSHDEIKSGEYVCYVCGDTYTEKQNLMTHRKSVHDNMALCKNFQTNSCKFSDGSCWWKHELSNIIKNPQSQVFQLPPDNLAPPSKMSQQTVLESLEQLTLQMAQFKQILKGAGLLL